MKALHLAIATLLILACLPTPTDASTSGASSLEAASKSQVMLDNTRPTNTEDFPDGYWFGTQSLLCVMGMTGSASSSGRKRRGLFNSKSRYSLRLSHRVLYYRGFLYEWGTGTLGYFIGHAPSVVECDITWEKELTGNSSCSVEKIKSFTYNYRSLYGVYNIATNNCHHFVNRVVQLLSSRDCSAAPGSWTRLAQAFWRYVGGFVEGKKPLPVYLDDINDHHDRAAIN